MVTLLAGSHNKYQYIGLEMDLIVINVCVSKKE